MNCSRTQKRILNIFSSWFYTKPLFFSISCNHSVVENENLKNPFRVGKYRIEFNPALLEKTDDAVLDELLQVEITRIVLGHPYQRQPYHAKPAVLLLASDAVIAQIQQNEIKKNPKSPKAEVLNNLSGVQYLKQKCGPYATFPQMNFEQWYKFIFDIVYSAKGGENAGSTDVDGFETFEEMSELWQEDENALDEIENDIKNFDENENVNGLGGGLSRAIKESADFSFDYRRALTQFRQNIVSANRKLTRMRPSRRYGFKAMGSRYERKANILIAVDVSGSISDESFDHFTHAIKNFFFLGLIEKIDLIFFDDNLRTTEPIPFSKKVNLKEIAGRGGTNFQIPVDFFEENKSEYSGMILFTDGEGECPCIKSDGKSILWILDSKVQYEKNRQIIENLAKCRVTYLPF